MAVTSDPPPTTHPVSSGTGAARIAFRAFAIGFILALATTTLCASATGATLGMFFGGIFIATFLTPPLVAAERTLSQRSWVALGIAVGIGSAWVGATIALGTGEMSFAQWLRILVLLVAYLFSLAGVTLLLLRIDRTAVISAALTTLLALAWLTWPVWLSPRLAGENRAVERLTIAHPLLALNGVQRNAGAWSERRIAYSRLTNLGQDVAYELPRSVVPCVILHSLLGAGCVGIAMFKRARRERT